jgi:hypothetical protein
MCQTGSGAMFFHAHVYERLENNRNPGAPR